MSEGCGKLVTKLDEGRYSVYCGEYHPLVASFTFFCRDCKVKLEAENMSSKARQTTHLKKSGRCVEQ